MVVILLFAAWVVLIDCNSGKNNKQSPGGGVDKLSKNGLERFQPYKWKHYFHTIFALIYGAITLQFSQKYYLVGMNYRILFIRQKYGNQQAHILTWTSERCTKYTKLNFY